MKPLEAALRATCCLALAVPATSDVLFLGSPDGVVRSGDPTVGSFGFLAVCGGPIHSMTLDGDDLFIGDTDGSIYHYDGASGFVTYSFQAPNDATALLMHNGQLLIGGSDATVQRVDKLDGTVLEVLDAVQPVGAMQLIGGELYVGSSTGVVHKGNPVGGPLGFWGTCGGPIQSMAHDSTHVLLGTTSGAIYRIDRTTQQVTGSFAAPNDAAALVKHTGDLLAGGGDATVQRVHRANGTVKGSFTTSFGVSAMALAVDPEPGFPYCYGIAGACPCGNMDAEGGCANSDGVGALLFGSGSASVTADDLVLSASNLPPNKNGRFYMGAAAPQITFGAGLFCAGSGGYGVRRFPVFNSGANGTGELSGVAAWAAQNFPPQNQVFPGSNWNFQVWYRDPFGPCGETVNTTNAFNVTFLP